MKEVDDICGRYNFTVEEAAEIKEILREINEKLDEPPVKTSEIYPTNSVPVLLHGFIEVKVKCKLAMCGGSKMAVRLWRMLVWILHHFNRGSTREPNGIYPNAAPRSFAKLVMRP